MFTANRVSTNTRTDGSRFVAFEAQTEMPDPALAAIGLPGTIRVTAARHYINVASEQEAALIIDGTTTRVSAGKIAIAINAEKASYLVIAA